MSNLSRAQRNMARIAVLQAKINALMEDTNGLLSEEPVADRAGARRAAKAASVQLPQKGDFVKVVYSDDGARTWVRGTVVRVNPNVLTLSLEESGETQKFEMESVFAVRKARAPKPEVEEALPTRKAKVKAAPAKGKKPAAKKVVKAKAKKLEEESDDDFEEDEAPAPKAKAKAKTSSTAKAAAKKPAARKPAVEDDDFPDL
jgi:hypothetical protein